WRGPPRNRGRAEPAGRSRTDAWRRGTTRQCRDFAGSPATMLSSEQPGDRRRLTDRWLTAIALVVVLGLAASSETRWLVAEQLVRLGLAPASFSAAVGRIGVDIS